MKKLLLATAASIFSMVAFSQSGAWKPLDPDHLANNGRGVYIEDPSNGTHDCMLNPEILCAKASKNTEGVDVLEFFNPQGRSMGVYSYTSAEYRETPQKVEYRLTGSKKLN